MLTGDKMETAVNIGYGDSLRLIAMIFNYFLVWKDTNCSSCNSYRYACSLLRQGMKQIVIKLDSPDIISLQKQGDKEAIAKVKNYR